MANSPAMDSSGVVTCTILINGAPLADAIGIESVEVYRSYNRIPHATITILDGDMPTGTFPLSDEALFQPGASLQVNAGYDGTATKIFDGIVIKHGIQITGQNRARLVIECRDKALAMTVGRKNANFVDMKDSAVIAALVAHYADLKVTASETDTVFKELVQFYCTDWDFMLARAEVNGLLVNVDGGQIHVKAPETTQEPVLTVTYGTDLLEFHAELDSRTQLQSVQATGWDLATQAVVQQSAAPQELNQQGNLQSADLAKVLGVATYEMQSTVPLDSSSLSSWSKAQQLKSGLSRIRGRMRFQGSAKATVGCLIELKGVGARFTGDVLVSGVRHQIRDGDWTSVAEFGLSANWFTEREEINARPASGVTAGVGGLQVGIVKKLNEDPDSQYKIQVSVPVMQAAADGVWARLANFYGSSGFGAFFIPEIGDEVILGYFNDDPSHPVILGSLYSSKNKPAYELTADNFTKAIVTRSKLTVEFDDDKKVITLVTPAKNTIVISDDGKSILLQDQNSNKVEMNASGITLASPKNIVLDAKGNISLKAAGNVEVTATADVTATGLNVTNNAKVAFTAKGAATAELSASGQTTVKGSMVMIN